MLTVVLATADGGRLDIALPALTAACAGLSARILVVTTGDVAPVTASNGAAAATIEVIRAPAGSLVPDLWGAGLRAATGEAVAFTSTACAVAPDWARAFLDTLRSGADGVGGPFALGEGASAVDSAMFYLRYSRFLEGTTPDLDHGGEIAGDNAAYRLSALARHPATGGFWEVVFHRSLRADGGRLAWRPDAVARFSSHMTLGQALAQRFVHGRHSGAFRMAGGRPRWKILLAAPLVPAVLARRAFGFAARSSSHRRRFLTVLPMFLLLASSWAAGEALGAVGGGLRAK
jgi:hypothetical protein